MFKRRGQTILEYTILIIIVLGVFVAMKDYIKRGIQGRWKSATDDFGDQYDPRLVNSKVMHTLVASSNTEIKVVEGALSDGTQGKWTNREDTSHSLDTKTGDTTVGSLGPASVAVNGASANPVGP